MSEISISARSITATKGPEWGAAWQAAENVQEALKALDALNIGAAKELLHEALFSLPWDNDQYYDWPRMEILGEELRK